MGAEPITIHVVLNAHIDPVWLWPWQRGLDTAINTCRTMCQLLENDEELIFVHDCVWLYAEIELVDPALFRRIETLIERGQWNIAGGWWVQPDCNTPSLEGLRYQILCGHEYLDERFGICPKVGFNIDTFGHPASLPTLMRQHDQDCYVMMRPQEHERPLPARIFRWSQNSGTPEVITFRVAGAYATFGVDGLREHIERSLWLLPDGLEHTMCFIGVGDHGGGPTVDQIEWIKTHRTGGQGRWRLEISTPERFFDSIRGERENLPVVTGELQPHAIGCYSVYRSIKQASRRAENMLLQAATFADQTSSTEAQLRSAWRDVAISQFHDIIAGTSVESAYPQIHDRLGRAAAFADELIQRGFRRAMTHLLPDTSPRLLLFNSHEQPRRELVTVELSRLEQRAPLPKEALFLDEDGEAIPHQVIAPEAAVDGDHMAAVLLDLTLPSREIVVIRIDESGERKPSKHVTCPTHAGAHGLDGLRTSLSRRDGDWGIKLGPISLPLPRLEVVDDPSDTWSHGLDGYAVALEPACTMQGPDVLESGPLRSSLAFWGDFGSSCVELTVRAFAYLPMLELSYDIDWCERHKLLKLTFQPAELITSRVDGIPGGSLERPLDCAEAPLQGWCSVTLLSAAMLGLLCPDALALDADARNLRFTLLRSPLFAHHDPTRAEGVRGVSYCDRGRHHFMFQLWTGEEALPERLHNRYSQWRHPLLIAETTKGMENLTTTRR